jgi:hypothetical protein
MAGRRRRNYWQLPGAVLAGMKLVMFAAAMYVAAMYVAALVRFAITGGRAFTARLIVYGAGRRAASLMQLPALGSQGFTIVGFVPAVGDEPGAVSTERRIELRTGLLRHCKANAVPFLRKEPHIALLLGNSAADGRGHPRGERRPLGHRRKPSPAASAKAICGAFAPGTYNGP